MAAVAIDWAGTALQGRTSQWFVSRPAAGVPSCGTVFFLWLLGSF